MMKIPELLAPAGSFESLRAAVNAGADAVYIGGPKFGARAYAENPDEDRLIEGIRYAHLFGVKVHLTVNTLLKDAELKELCAYIRPYYEAGLDAVIVQDLGVLRMLRTSFPLLCLHASTQTTVTGPESAKIMKSLGACRVIPARELSLSELRGIKEETGMEVETFVHGALCYSYSGQCLMSSLIGGRSGNRGRCAQTCRLKYSLYSGNQKLNGREETCLLSCRDLCSLDLLPDLAAAGLDSLKIEGRMKSPRYTAGVVAIWRKYLDLYRSAGRKNYRVDPADRKLLLDLFDRGGQTDGYYFRHNGPEMMALKDKPEFREGNENYFRYLDETFVNAVRKRKISGHAEIRAGKPMRLTVRTLPDGLTADGSGEATAEAAGPVPAEAVKAPAAEQDVREKLMKTGGSCFDFETLEIDLDKGLFVPVKLLNELRRSALSALQQNLLRPFERPDSPEKTAAAWSPEAFVPGPAGIHVSADSTEQLRAAAESPDVREISFSADAAEPEDWAELVRYIRKNGKRAYLLMPQIFRKEACDFFGRAETELVRAGFDGFVIRSLEEPGYLKRVFADGRCPDLYFDFNVYGMNRTAQRVLTELGAKRLTLPVELNAGELAETGCAGKELIVSGRLPMMVSAQCLKKNIRGCDRKPEVLYLEDRTGKKMPAVSHCPFCYNVILNAEPVSLCGMQETVRKLDPESFRILLTTESRDESAKVISACAEAFLRGKTVPEPYPDFTRGHLKRGVE